MRPRLLLALVMFVSCISAHVAFAAPVDAGLVDASSMLGEPIDAGVIAVGSGSAVVTTTTTTVVTPADALHDPLESPLAALDDAKEAKQKAWPIFLFAILTMITKALAYGAEKLQGLPVIGAAAKWLAVGKRAVWVSGIGTLAGTGYNTLIAGGTWVALLVALGMAGAGLMHSTTQAKAPA